VKEARLARSSDLRRVAKFVKQHRATYLSTYRALRDRVFAHTVTADREQIAELFSKTNIRQLQRMTTDLGHLHDAFWQAFHNGGRLTLRRRRYSIARMLKRPRGMFGARVEYEGFSIPNTSGATIASLSVFLNF
jgi:AbiU2